MFENFKIGMSVAGSYFGVRFTGVVVSSRLNEFTRNDQIEVEFDTPLTIRGTVRSGQVFTNLGSDDYIKVI